MMTDQHAFCDLLSHAHNVAPLQRNFAKTLRRVLQITKSLSGEFDPTKSLHMAAFCEIIACVTMVLAPIVGDFRNLFDPAFPRDKFEEMLRFYIWGGREAYLVRQRMHHLAARIKENGQKDLEFYEWGMFVDTARSLLDGATALPTLVMPVRELSFRFLSESDERADARLGKEISSNSRARQFLFLIAEYVTRATRLPADALARFEAEVNKLHALGEA